MKNIGKWLKESDHPWKPTPGIERRDMVVMFRLQSSSDRSQLVRTGRELENVKSKIAMVNILRLCETRRKSEGN